MKAEAIAREMALLPQGPQAPAGLTCSELVGYGRYSWLKGFGRLNEEDKAIIDKAMKEISTTDLKERPVDNLSGSQRQRVWIAMCLAQNTPLILLDEPRTYLDMAHQLEILELLKRLNEEDGKTMALVIHDLNLAARFADWLIAMKDGKVLFEGISEDIMTAEVMQNVFGLDALIETDPWIGKPTMVTYRSEVR